MSPHSLGPEDVSLACATGDHESCTQERCACTCHTTGGVREPRFPKDPAPRFGAEAKKEEEPKEKVDMVLQ